MKPLLAYEVREPGEGHCVIRFASSSAAARREGANELDCGFNEVEHCHRKPQFDQYAPGPVPHAVLIDHGWWFECHHCSRRVSEDMQQEAEDEGEEREYLEVVTDANVVYCSQNCVMGEFVERRARKAAEVALIEFFSATHPDCTIESVWVSRAPLQGPGRLGHAQALLYFKFPGAQHRATFTFGEDRMRVTVVDLPAYYTWRGIQMPTTEAA
ncbi:hypothetical protein CSQ93_21790 [Janthinobacterium sp. BJB426]|uniref:hypothetical protein n=1 Tax=Janthinobacterium sp. BJB426 TaxID=2048010 RepID=UPI000C0EC010|nr:hypothetical protein [Janthinobacterium sp. BJB426]PHV25848.1 hypothetical protein CSQ93_21790 [Janthinobacterium sp. BJB426]